MWTRSSIKAFDARYAIVARLTARERTLAAARSDDFHAEKSAQLARGELPLSPPDPIRG